MMRSTTFCATRPQGTVASGWSNGQQLVQAHPDWLAGDHLHGNETGYRERARAVAAATNSCTPAVNLTAQ